MKILGILVCMLFLLSVISSGTSTRINSEQEKMKLDQINPMDENTLGTPNGGIIEVVSTESTFTSMIPSLAVDSEGTVHVVWQESTNYDDSGDTICHIFYKKKPLGGSWSTVEVVTAGSSYHSLYPSLAIDLDGTVHIAWRRDKWDTEQGFYKKYIYYKNKPLGESWSTEELVSIESYYCNYSPSLVVDTNRTVHVTWVEETTGNVEKILYKNKPHNGSWSATELVENMGTNGYPTKATLAVDLDETVYITWQGTSVGGHCWGDIYYKNKPLGESWSATEVVSTESPYDSYHPSLVVDSSGTIHIAWQDESWILGSGSDFDIFYKYKPLGENWSTTEVVSLDSTYNSFNPSLAVDLDGTLYVAWHDCSNTSWGQIFYAKKIIDNLWTEAELISTVSDRDAQFSSLGVDLDGNIHVAWQDNSDYFGAGHDWDIFYYSPLATGPVPIIENVFGGFRIGIGIKNVGNEVANDVKWTINTSVNGPFAFVVFGAYHEGTISTLQVNESIIINRFICGLGQINIEVSVGPSSKTYRGFLFGLLVIP